MTLKLEMKLRTEINKLPIIKNKNWKVKHCSFICPKNYNLITEGTGNPHKIYEELIQQGYSIYKSKITQSNDN